MAAGRAAACPRRRTTAAAPSNRDFPALATMFDNIRQDLAAHRGDWAAQGFWALLVYRFGRWRYGVRPAVLRK